ncbi:hypothetical protein B0H13DRAFT_2666838, partial [Mycena leptocephala]
MLELARRREGTRGRSRRRNRISGYRSHKREPGIQRVDGKIRYPSTDDYYDDDDEENN